MALKDLLALVESTDAFRGIARDLGIGSPLSGPTTAPGAPDQRERGRVAKDGFGSARAAMGESACAALVDAVDALHERGLPATFLYAFDETWVAGETVRSRISQLLGREYRLIEDVWAWHIPPGQGGWPPHRGVSDVCLDRDAPEILNAWVALSDVTADRACMHGIPLNEDPGYPGDLQRVDAPLSAVRAMPAAAGDVLFWNANALHWGGQCAEGAAGPRVSCSFTLCRSDAIERFPALALLRPLAQLDLATRMDVVARMIITYGKDQPDVSDMVRHWASLTVALSTRFGHRKAP